MKIGLKYKNEEHIFDECISAGVPFLKYPILEKEGLVEHGISTRLGGVSEGFLGSMNLSYTRGDDPAHVDENYRRIAAAIRREARSIWSARIRPIRRTYGS